MATNIIAKQSIKSFEILGTTVKFDYSYDNTSLESELKDGWYCQYCQIQNYPRRQICFQCHISRQGNNVYIPLILMIILECEASVYYQNDGSKDVSPCSTSMILIRGLNTNTNEEAIYSSMCYDGIIYPTRIWLARDRNTLQSSGFAFIEYPTQETTNAVYASLNKIYPPFHIEGYPIIVTYGRDLHSENGIYTLDYWDKDIILQSWQSTNPSIQIEQFLSDIKQPIDNVIESKWSKPMTEISYIETPMSKGKQIQLNLEKWEKIQKDTEIQVDQIQKAQIPVSTIDNTKELIDIERIACLICKRKFNAIQDLERHIQLSELHRTNMESRSRKIQIEETKHEIKEEYINPSISETLQSEPEIDPYGEESDNIGARLMKKMGWKKGEGLGKDNTGITEPIKVQRIIGSGGIGSCTRKRK